MTATEWTAERGDWVYVAGRDGLCRIVGVYRGKATVEQPGSANVVTSVDEADLRATATTLQERRLGRNQRRTLEALRTRGPWPGNGCTLSSTSATRRIIESLARRGMAEPCTYAPGRWRAVRPEPLPAAGRGPIGKVYTRAELQDPTRRPKVHRAGDSFLVAAPRRANPRDDEDSVYRLATPCCGKSTLVSQWTVDRMLDGRLSGHFQCGKAWDAGRGNSRRGGCRAVYNVRPILYEGQQQPAMFELTWTGR